MIRNAILGGLLAAIALLAVSCSSTRYYKSSEYDDVYYSSRDVTNPETPQVDNTVADTRPQNNNTGAPVYSSPDRNGSSYNDYYYSTDDFYFSRRIRRFSNPRLGFRYYDPFFANDLYYVMGTPAWSRWNSRGWYSWNSPRFGVYWGYNPGWDPFFYNGFFNPYVYNPWNTVNYYNPWVGTYYGYGAGFGYSGFGGWGYYNWGPTYGGLGGWGYCPPSYYRNGSFGNGGAGTSTGGAYTRYREAHRNSPGSLASNPGFSPRSTDLRGRVKSGEPRTGAPVSGMQPGATINDRRDVGNIDYLRPPENRTPQPAVRPSNSTRQPTVQPSNTRPRTAPRVYKAPDRTPQVTPSRTPRTTPSRQVRPQSAPQRTPSVTPRRNDSPRRTPSVTPRQAPSRTPAASPRRNTSQPRMAPSRRTPSSSGNGSGRNNLSSPVRRN